MNANILLTPSQAAELLEISSSSLRRYSAWFSENLSELASRRGRVRHHSYSYDDIIVLYRIRQLLKEGRTIDEVKEIIGCNKNPNMALARIPEIYSVRIDDVVPDDYPIAKKDDRKIRFSTLARGHVLYEIKQGFTSEKYIPMTFSQWQDTLLFFDCVCAYCGGRAQVFEHFIPARKGGRFVYGNIVPACNSCNTKKGYHDPFEWMGVNCGAEYVSRVIEFISASMFVRIGGTSVQTSLAPQRLNWGFTEAPDHGVV